MNYIGSKYSLRDFIDNTIKKVVGDNPSDMVFCDLFVYRRAHFKTRVSKVIANNWKYYSYVLNRNYIGNCYELANKADYIEILNSLSGTENGLIYSQYCRGGGNDRQYFSDDNDQK